MSSKLQLVCPSEHDIYFNLDGDGYAEPINGSVKLHYNEALVGTAPQLQLRLIRTVASENKQTAISARESQFLRKIKRPFLNTTKQEESYKIESCAIINETTRHISLFDQTRTSGCTNSINIPFSIAVPVNTPGTTTTSLGKITYSIIATMLTPGRDSFNTAQPIHLARKLIPDRHSIQHIRSYSKSPVINQITLSQDIPVDSNSWLSACANISLRQAMTMTQRDSEFKCATIRTIHWRVEEVTRLVTQDENNLQYTDNADFLKEESVREICSGKHKGYWSSHHNPLVKQRHQKSEEQDSTLDIPLEISIPKTAHLSSRVDETFYTSTPSRVLGLSGEDSPMDESNVIIVEHRLKLDFITGEDTFDTRSNNLVDRKPHRSTLSAIFPLLIENGVKCDFEAVAFSNPPRYEDISLSPPEYITLE
ncbi:hypothetical protein N7478_008505 [Penicillium angulare]|uniref:uncharacterized protein n=1 Tax=Penicillium angulare TaxID=116970 RepID=UPI002541822A|nr:uncharacterized protein N7478_008505 [Penicillium angulare]KAJ5273380.1 hypothetical protein N7478_008505 [Penicillium angulare]